MNIWNPTLQMAPKGDYFECNAIETQAAMLHRFAVTVQIRYRAIHEKK